MVRPVMLGVAMMLGGCTAAAFTCGQPVPCGAGSAQSCASRDGNVCRYQLSDGQILVCASCRDCYEVQLQVAAWCAGDDGGSADGVGSGGGAHDLGATPSPPSDMASAAGNPPVADMAHAADLAWTPPDLASTPFDLAWTPPDFSSPDLGCYPFEYQCNGDPDCCAHCCAGGCAQVGWCAAF